MLKNYHPRERKTDITYELLFTDGIGNGFVFPCDENGEVTEELSKCAIDNLNWCKQHPQKFVRFNEVAKRKTSYTEDAHGTCTCGEEVYLYDQYYGACQCPNCGRWYNLFGQELVPPEYWEQDPSEEEYW